VGFQNKQIICQGLEENANDWHTGVGRIDELGDVNEEHYSYLHTDLQGSNLEKLINHFGCFRTRIMTMSPKSCYNVHRDSTPRLHLPIITNFQCWVVWPEDNSCHRMTAGDIYWADTTRPHTFMLASDEWRIHLVMGTKNFYNT
jgi:Aspartyl/Asparaginyl beta-hydroxylase